MALESLLYNKYSVETDKWSYGVTLWEMFTLYDPHVNEAVRPYEEIEDNNEVKKIFDASLSTFVTSISNTIFY